MGTHTAHSAVVAADRARDFDEFFRIEYPRLRRLLSTADLHADDALQEAFTRAALAWSRVAAYDDPAGWVRRVAVRRILNERRSSRRRHAAMERLEAPTEPADGDRESGDRPGAGDPRTAEAADRRPR